MQFIEMCKFIMSRTMAKICVSEASSSLLSAFSSVIKFHFSWISLIPTGHNETAPTGETMSTISAFLLRIRGTRCSVCLCKCVMLCREMTVELNALPAVSLQASVSLERHVWLLQTGCCSQNLQVHLLKLKDSLTLVFKLLYVFYSQQPFLSGMIRNVLLLLCKSISCAPTVLHISVHLCQPWNRRKKIINIIKDCTEPLDITLTIYHSQSGYDNVLLRFLRHATKTLNVNCGFLYGDAISKYWEKPA